MLSKTKLLTTAVGLLGVVGLATDTNAATTFRLGSPGVTLSLGTGWGDGENRLAADFDLYNVSNTQFVLNVGQTFSLAVGDISLDDSCIDTGANGCTDGDGDETNNLQVTYTFNMTLPGDVDVAVSATGVATPGSVSDGEADLVLDFAPQLVNFGTGGVYRVDIRTINFSGNGVEYTVTADVDLLSEPPGVPEPMSLGLLGAGLLGLAIAVRRRRS